MRRPRASQTNWSSMTVHVTCWGLRCLISDIPALKSRSARTRRRYGLPTSASFPRGCRGLLRSEPVLTCWVSTCRLTRDTARLLKGFSGILITVTNPMDIMNYYLWKTTGMPREHCIGFGGQLDSARFGIALRERKISGSPSVLGEHGEHQVPLFSRLDRTVEVPVREEILSGLRGASMEVIRGKGGTVFGPAFHIARLIRVIVSDTRELAACSAGTGRRIWYEWMFAGRPCPGRPKRYPGDRGMGPGYMGI